MVSRLLPFYIGMFLVAVAVVGIASVVSRLRAPSSTEPDPFTFIKIVIVGSMLILFGVGMCVKYLSPSADFVFAMYAGVAGFPIGLLFVAILYVIRQRKKSSK